MKKILLIILTPVLLLSCQNNASEKDEKASNDVVATIKYELAIEGMTCTGCEETIEAGVKKVEGVVTVDASHTDARAIIGFSGEPDTAAIREIVTASGYKVLEFSKAE